MVSSESTLHRGGSSAKTWLTMHDNGAYDLASFVGMFMSVDQMGLLGPVNEAVVLGLAHEYAGEQCYSGNSDEVVEEPVLVPSLS